MKNIAVLFIFLFQTGLTAQTTRCFEFSVICGHGSWQDTSLIAATDDPAVICGTKGPRSGRVYKNESRKSNPA